MTSAALTAWEVKALVYRWFDLLTNKAALADMQAMLHPTELRMVFPEATLASQKDFIAWYETVTHKYLDQVHELKVLDVAVDDASARVNLVVNWQARVWESPAPYSTWMGFNVQQRWEVVRHPSSRAAVIKTYTVEHADPMAGSRAI